MRTIEYDPTVPSIQMIDQRALPGKLKMLRLKTTDEVIHAIRDMAVRGAPAIGITAAFGMALASRVTPAETFPEWASALERTAELLGSSRPTAINLQWALHQMLTFSRSLDGSDLETARRKMDERAQQMADEDVEINRRMAAYGAALIQDSSTIIHHCNTGALAAVDYGTALGVIRFTHESGKKVHVLVDETRPRLQGARLTAWELEQYGIGYDIIADNAAGYFLQRGAVNAVLVGADRIAANGDVANKIGTYMLALAAMESTIPFYCVAPRSTFDLSFSKGEDIPIEERPAEEVLSISVGQDRTVPEGASARNPAFDITPHRLITAFITEFGVIDPPFDKHIERIFKEGSP